MSSRMKTVLAVFLAMMILVWCLGLGAVYLVRQIFIAPSEKDIEYVVQEWAMQRGDFAVSDTGLHFQNVRIPLPNDLVVSELKREVDTSTPNADGVTTTYRIGDQEEVRVVAYKYSDEIQDRILPVYTKKWVNRLLFPEVDSTYEFLLAVHNADPYDFTHWNLIHDARQAYLLWAKCIGYSTSPATFHRVNTKENIELLLTVTSYKNKSVWLVNFKNAGMLHDIFFY